VAEKHKWEAAGEPKEYREVVHMKRLMMSVMEGKASQWNLIKIRLALLLLFLVFLSGIQVFAQDVPADLLAAVEKEGKTLNFYNWGEYIHPDIIPMFEEEYGIDVTYDTFGGQDELLAKIQAAGGVYDLVVPTQDKGYIMKQQGLLQPLNHDWIPNMKNLMPKFIDPFYDPGNKYMMPWLWGFTVFAYNSKYVDLPFTDSWWLMYMGHVFDQRLSGKIAMMNEFPNDMYPALKLLGYSLNTSDEKALMEMREIMLAQKPGVVAYLPGSVVLKELISEDVWVAKLWNGKALRAKDENPAIRVVLPREGFELWADQMCIPAGCAHPAAAHLFINYIMRPAIGAMNATYNKYATPYKTSLPYIDEEDREDPVIYPSEEQLEPCEFALPHPLEVREIYEAIWEELVG